ncbi:sulfotransferase family protein [Paraglaciecola sp. T6c]|uniref:sulfotransferase family protein n=1 Tax=Pseudoalteromonas atlantica (strain T6c / ATCC BAA-1087) TaxID=3042615 RepID=UPI0018DCDECF|nr:sulfotransferase [Paraglaciecola sp. T6c]
MSVKQGLATVGYVHNLNDFTFSFDVSSDGILFSLFTLENVADKTNHLSTNLQLEDREISISFTEQELLKDTLSYVIFGVQLDGKKTKVASITFSHTQNVPDVTLIVGAPRSGTTALGGSLRTSTEYSGHEESHVAPLFQHLISSCDQYFTDSPASKNAGTLAYDVTPTHIEAELLNVLRRIHRVFYGDKFVIDKTPGIPMIEALPVLLRAYPHAKVIFCKRRGIENVRSRLKKFGDTKFENHCQQWTRTLIQWRNAQKVISVMLGHSQWKLEVEQFELANEPAPVVEKIAAHLGLTQKQKDDMSDFLRRESPQQSYEKSAISLEKTGWSEEDISIFKRHCDKEMTRQGYSYTEDYYLR